jgi:hypothetical protein
MPRMDTEQTVDIGAPGAKRRSRMRRVATRKRVQITPRDVEILRLLKRYRYLRSSFLHALVGGKSQKRFIERLGHLYHEGGYVDRPAQQWQAINARYMPAVYELGQAGERLLEALDGESIRSQLARKGRQGAVRQFQHDLMICDIIASIEVGTRSTTGVRLVSWDEIMASPKMPRATREAPNPFAMPVSITYTCPDNAHPQRWEKPLIPDALFGIEYASRYSKTYRFFALEADRNTEPVVRGSPVQTSYLRKILQYRALAAGEVHRSHFGLPNLLVLTVTTNEQHMRNVMRCLLDVTKGDGDPAFLFKTMSSLNSLEVAPVPSPHIIVAPWDRVGRPHIRIDQP